MTLALAERRCGGGGGFGNFFEDFGMGEMTVSPQGTK